jgi:hypothetical protein
VKIRDFQQHESFTLFHTKGRDILNSPVTCRWVCRSVVIERPPHCPHLQFLKDQVFFLFISTNVDDLKHRIRGAGTWHTTGYNCRSGICHATVGNHSGYIQPPAVKLAVSDRMVRYVISCVSCHYITVSFEMCGDTLRLTLHCEMVAIFTSSFNHEICGTSYTIHHQLLQKNCLHIYTNFDNWLQKLKTRAQHFRIYLYKNFQPVWWCSECDPIYANHKWTKLSHFNF